MTLPELKKDFQSQLSGHYPSGEISSFWRLFVEKYLGLSPAEVILQPDRKLSGKERHLFKVGIDKLTEHQPVQYILGETEFCGLKLNVTPDVLIPRPETEELVNWVVENSPDKPLDILDIGTGSGCIAIALANLIPQARLSAMDISGPALKIARENAAIHGVDISFIKGDILQTDRLPKWYDIIVSNPPYVCGAEKHSLPNNVLNYEPHRALFAPDDDPLLFYKKIGALARNQLKKGGFLYVELNEKYENEAYVLMKDFSFSNITLKKDIYEKARMLRARL